MPERVREELVVKTSEPPGPAVALDQVARPLTVTAPEPARVPPVRERFLREVAALNVRVVLGPERERSAVVEKGPVGEKEPASAKVCVPPVIWMAPGPAREEPGLPVKVELENLRVAPAATLRE